MIIYALIKTGFKSGAVTSAFPLDSSSMQASLIHRSNPGTSHNGKR